MSPGKILLVAYQCAPGMGSVSQIGWEWYSRLAAENKITLVTHVRNRAALEGAGAPVNDSEIIYIDTEWFAGPLYRTSRRLFPFSEHSVFLVSSLDYFIFDYIAYRKLRVMVEHHRWSVLHRVTPVTLAAATWLGRLGLPMVIGPLNSGLKDPPGFDRLMKQESTWLIKARKLGSLFDTLIGSSKRAHRILTASKTTFNAVSVQHQSRCRMMLENGVDLSRFAATAWPDYPTDTQPLQVLFVGRLIPIKGLDMLLEAVGRLRSSGRAVELHVVGDGPLREKWIALTRLLKLEASIIFHGALSQDDVAKKLTQCHVLCLPSVRESGGAVLLEAMACARPVIGLNFGGPAEIITQEVGVLLPLHSPQQVIRDLTTTLDSIYDDPLVWAQRGAQGREKIEQNYSWPAKISAARETYLELIVERSLSCC